MSGWTFAEIWETAAAQLPDAIGRAANGKVDYTRLRDQARDGL